MNEYEELRFRIDIMNGLLQTEHELYQDFEDEWNVYQLDPTQEQVERLKEDYLDG